MRRHAPGVIGREDLAGGGVEPRRREWRHRRRSQRSFPAAHLSGRREGAGIRQSGPLPRARGARYRRRRRSGNRIPDSRGREGRRIWRNQRGGAAMGGADCVDQRATWEARGLPEHNALRERGERVARYYHGNQRRLSGRTRMGRLHGFGESERPGAAAGAEGQVGARGQNRCAGVAASRIVADRQRMIAATTILAPTAGIAGLIVCHTPYTRTACPIGHPPTPRDVERVTTDGQVTKRGQSPWSAGTYFPTAPCLAPATAWCSLTEVLPQKASSPKHGHARALAKAGRVVRT